MSFKTIKVDLDKLVDIKGIMEYKPMKYGMTAKYMKYFKQKGIL